MRKVLFILNFILACILGFFLQLLFHEMGHAIFALITGNEIMSINFGVVSYAEIQVLNHWSVWIISIGSFVFPIIVCLFFELFHNEFLRLLSTVVLTITTIQLGINAVAVLCVKDLSELQTYDLGICITSAGMNNIFVSIIALICVTLLSIWVIYKLKRIADNV
ncbi:MAG: hypothetical protein IJ272_02250 [Clostridia bacterium]|nr:hypothetical protein [Clostridia bacterium]